VHKGILPAPAISSGQAHYGYEHLLRLVAVKIYQGRYLPLKEIGIRLSAMSLDDLEVFITNEVLETALRPAPALNLASPGQLRSGAADLEVRAEAQTLPSIPEVPLSPADPLPPRIPLVYQETGTHCRYRLVAVADGNADEVEAQLNSLGAKGWRLAGILSLENRSFFVMVS
jgi:hypothetical protein